MGGTVETPLHEARGVWTLAGFTLLEMLIAVVILGILAIVIVPLLKSPTDDVKVNATKASLATMRSAIENYAIQHNGAYPGAAKRDGTGEADATECAAAFVEQLTRYSEASGKTHLNKPTTGVSYGPYIKSAGLPANPFNGKGTVSCDVATTDLAARAAAANVGWKFYMKTGVFIASDGGNSGKPAVAHVNY